MTDLDAAREGRIDLHCHSHHSDGVLSPEALVALAAARGVRLLALTDHDSTAGCDEAGAAAAARGIRFLTGVELTARWQSEEIHIVGLRVQTEAASLRHYCGALQALRRDRVEQMTRKLVALGVPDEPLRAQLRTMRSPTRTHLARALVAAGRAPSVQGAFDRYLGRGGPAWCEAHWPGVESAVAAIVASGGVAVLAHPHRYRLGKPSLSALTGAFREAGGAGIEVSMAGMSPAQSAAAARLARRHALEGSVGSDFHEPGLPWRPLGRFVKLPEAVHPITDRLTGASAPPG